MAVSEISGRALRRIEKEIEKFQRDNLNGLSLEVVSPSCWLIHITGADSTLYSGEVYTLKVTFSDDYPMDSPEVMFISTQ